MASADEEEPPVELRPAAEEEVAAVLVASEKAGGGEIEAEMIGVSAGGEAEGGASCADVASPVAIASLIESKVDCFALASTAAKAAAVGETGFAGCGDGDSASGLTDGAGADSESCLVMVLTFKLVNEIV